MDDLKRLFACTCCGYCCQGETTVSLDDNDIYQMTRELKLEPAELEKRYLRRTKQEVQMKTVDGHCVFYQNGCSVHGGRPWRCRQWPLVPAILTDEANFNIIKESCPGITRELSYDQFCRILKGCLEKTDTIFC